MALFLMGVPYMGVYRLTGHDLRSTTLWRRQARAMDKVALLYRVFFYSHHGLAPANAWTQHMNNKKSSSHDHHIVKPDMRQRCHGGRIRHVAGFPVCKGTFCVLVFTPASWTVYLRPLITTDCKTTHYVLWDT